MDQPFDSPPDALDSLIARALSADESQAQRAPAGFQGRVERAVEAYAARSRNRWLLQMTLSISLSIALAAAAIGIQDWIGLTWFGSSGSAISNVVTDPFGFGWGLLLASAFVVISIGELALAITLVPLLRRAAALN